MKILAGILLACSCYGINATYLTARYGSPVMQQFTVRPGIVLTVEYGIEGGAITVQIAPDGDRQYSPTPDKSMDHDVVFAVIDFFIPETERNDALESSRISGSINVETPVRTSVITLPDSQGTIRHSYIKNDDGERELFVLVKSASGLAQSANDVELHFGKPATEEFIAEPGIGVRATYDRQRVVARLEIAPLHHLADATPLSTMAVPLV